MPAALQITLTPEEDQTLRELELADGIPRRTQQRAICRRHHAERIALRLNGKGWTVERDRQLS